MTLTTLTDEQRSLVTQSFARLIPITAEAAEVFYNRLWIAAPETKSMFESTDMAALGLKLMQTLGVAVRALHDLETIRPFLRDLGRRHIGYGVKQEQYALVKVALVEMIAYCLGRDFTPAMREAWNTAYDLITAIATSAYE